MRLGLGGITLQSPAHGARWRPGHPRRRPSFPTAAHIFWLVMWIVALSIALLLTPRPVESGPEIRQEIAMKEVSYALQ
jgi:hypothetical protein